MPSAKSQFKLSISETQKQTYKPKINNTKIRPIVEINLNLRTNRKQYKHLKEVKIRNIKLVIQPWKQKSVTTKQETDKKSRSTGALKETVQGNKFNNNHNSCQNEKECYRIRTIYQQDLREALLNSDDKRTTQNQINQEYPILCVYINNVESNFLVVAGAEIFAISEELIKRNS